MTWSTAVVFAARTRTLLARVDRISATVLIGIGVGVALETG